MVQKVEKFANLGSTTLNGDIAGGATSLVVASATGFPTGGQFRVVIDQEIFLVTNVTGTTFTVVPGYESTAQLGHTSGATVKLLLTAGILQAIYPTGRQITGSGAVTMTTNDFIVEINKATPAATAVTLPTDPILFKTYRVIDFAGNAASYNITVTGSGGFSDVISSNRSSGDYYFNGTAWNVIRSAVPPDLSGYVPITRTINGVPLSSDITLDASDFGAPDGSGTSTGTNTGDQDLSGLVTKTTTVNGKPLSSNITLNASDVGAVGRSATRIITSAPGGSVTLSPDDDVVEIALAVPAAITVNLAASAVNGKIQTVKDGGFNCTSYPITLVPNTGNIDNQNNYVMDSFDGEAVSFYFNGTHTRIV